MNNTTNTSQINLDESAVQGMATLLTAYIITLLKMETNPMYFGMIQPIIKHFIQRLITQDFSSYVLLMTQYVTGYHLLGIFLLYFIYKNYSKVWNYCDKKINTKDMLTLNVYTEKDIKIFVEYIKHYRKFYDIPKSVDIGDLDIIYSGINRTYGTLNSLMASHKTTDDTQIKFNDENFNVSGQYTWTKREVKFDDTYEKKEKIIKIPQLILQLNREQKIDPLAYFEKITQRVDELLNDQMTQYYVKIYKEKGMMKYSTSLLYSGKKRTLKTLEHMYIDPFFHKMKGPIWNFIKTIQFSPDEIYSLGQIPRLGLLLYGEPGTGKSSFGYRIAMALKRHVVSLDILDINNKNDIFEIMRNPKVMHVSCRPKDVVFIFDEFDRTVFSILEGAKRKKHQKTIQIIDQNDKQTQTQGQEQPLLQIQNEDPNIVSTALCIEDLQEIFQGSIPLEDAIIIANTNRYEELKALCPALFRVGRLTPIKFDNADGWFINEVSKRFFDRETIVDTTGLTNLQPSAIIEMATKYKNNYYDNKYEMFYEELKDYLSEKISQTPMFRPIKIDKKIDSVMEELKLDTQTKTPIASHSQ